MLVTEVSVAYKKPGRAKSTGSWVWDPNILSWLAGANELGYVVWDFIPSTQVLPPGLWPFRGLPRKTHLPSKLFSSSSFFLKLFIYIRKADFQREKEIKIFHRLVHSPNGAELIWSQGPGASFGSPNQVLGPKVLGYFPLLSQALRRELDGKQSSMDTNR